LMVSSNRAISDRAAASSESSACPRTPGFEAASPASATPWHLVDAHDRGRIDAPLLGRLAL